MTDTKHQFERIQERCNLIKMMLPNSYRFFAAREKHANKILRLVNDIREIAKNGYLSQCDGYEEEKRSKEEYELMLQTCWMYFDIVVKEMCEYCKVLPKDDAIKWKNVEIDYYNDKINNLTLELASARNMLKIVKENWVKIEN